GAAGARPRCERAATRARRRTAAGLPWEHQEIPRRPGRPPRSPRSPGRRRLGGPGSAAAAPPGGPPGRPRPAVTPSAARAPALSERDVAVLAGRAVDRLVEAEPQ